MTPTNIRLAAEEARRFLKRVEAMKDAINVRHPAATLEGSKESGALRRASMDLTRALAQMRRSRND